MDSEILLWTKVAALGQVVGAVATAAAVIVSLWIVLSERAARVRVTAGLRLLIATGAPEAAQEVVNITVTNIGQRPIRVASIGWRTGWLNNLGPRWARYAYALQTSGQVLGSDDPPFMLEAGDRKSMLIDVSAFYGTERSAGISREIFSRFVPLFGSVPANIRCAAHIVGARSSYFAVEKPLARYLATGVPSGALDRFKGAAAKRVAKTSGR